MVDLAEHTVRVVAVVRGRVRAAEFGLHESEEGLSLFRCADEADVKLVTEAVRAAGKKGQLAAAALDVEYLVSLGLNLVATPGATPDPRANTLHVEARLSEAALDQSRRLGQAPWEFFNQQLAGAVWSHARVIYKG